MKDKLDIAASEYMNIPPVKAAIKYGCTEDLEAHIKVAFRNGAQWQLDNMWIPVEERLPEDDEDYFFGLDMNRNPPAVGACIYDKKLNIWYDEKIEITHITHWMPIPEFKKGE